MTTQTRAARGPTFDRFRTVTHGSDSRCCNSSHPELSCRYHGIDPAEIGWKEVTATNEEWNAATDALLGARIVDLTWGEAFVAGGTDAIDLELDNGHTIEIASHGVRDPEQPFKHGAYLTVTRLAASVAERNQIELSWAAGFFDGEGSVFCTSRGKRTRDRPQLGLTVSQSGPHAVALIRRFADAVGTPGKIYGPHADKTCVKYMYRVNAYVVVDVLQLLWPYLGPAKREQAQRAMKKYIDSRTDDSWKYIRGARAESRARTLQRINELLEAA